MGYAVSAQGANHPFSLRAKRKNTYGYWVWNWKVMGRFLLWVLFTITNEYFFVFPTQIEIVHPMRKKISVIGYLSVIRVISKSRCNANPHEYGVNSNRTNLVQWSPFKPRQLVHRVHTIFPLGWLFHSASLPSRRRLQITAAWFQKKNPSICGAIHPAVRSQV